MHYLVRRGSVEIGKFALADLKALLNAGVILPTDLFSIEGMTEAKPVSSLFSQETGLAAPAGVPPLPTVRTDNGGQVVLTMAIGPSCSSCLSTDVMKASVAYDLHVKQHSLSAGTLSGLRFWASGKTTNQVGANCAPPTKPVKSEPMLWSRLFVLIFALTTTALAASGLSGGKEGLSFLILALITGAFCYLCFRAWRRAEAELEAEHQKDLNRFHAKMADYDRTWRCNKCGVMYLT